MRCLCHIVPPDVLDRFRADPDLAEDVRKAMANTLLLDEAFRRVRDEATELSRIALSIAAPLLVAIEPSIAMFNCNHSQVLPGPPVESPRTSADPTTKNAFNETAEVVAFYKQLFGRNSVDGAGMALVSSVHYGQKYNNAFWNGSQMTYGDGDGQVFADFSLSQDIIAHELTHGVTQHSLQLAYADEAGGLNESISDCFGSMFKQWRRAQTSATADWLIGVEIMGTLARAKGFACLRDMANPQAAHALSKQPTTYAQYHHGMDPHASSGIPNLAFCTACKAAGGHSWDKVGPVWYRAVTDFGPTPTMKMKAFADRTRAVVGQLYPGDASLATAIDGGWKHVGL
ncbi:MAG TPA: M4 family metallopeptidase [Caulobacteraceae bacterium]|nr:M4 family metallopeptidase [Caulobacteraceae bacterium]